MSYAMHEPVTAEARASSMEQLSAKTSVAYWSLQLVGWGLYFYWQASGEVIFAGAPWSKAGVMWGGVCAAGIGLTHALRWFSKRQAWLELPPLALLIRVLAGLLLIAMTSFLIAIALSSTLYGTPVVPILGAFYRKLHLGGQLRNQFIGSLLIYAIWVAIYFGIAIQRRRHRAELRQVQLAEALRAAELRLLKAQLNPHFLFNALNGVRALIAGEPGKAQDAVTRLARTMRYTLASGEENLVTMARELEMVDDYLALESLRLAERLNVVRDIAPAALMVRIPVMLMQTLVENAIKHGIASLRQGGTLRIAAHVAASELIIEVINPCPERAAMDLRSESVGLKNLSERLRLLFGPAARLRLDLSGPGLAIAEVRLPA
jgi:two-component system sensor histidine kinase AlgZ